MFQLPGKRLAFVFSDQAGANACTALAKMAKHDVTVSLYSNRNYNNVKDIAPTQKQPLLDEIETVFLGTSHPASSDYYELNCLKEAKQKNVYTISFVDHWVNFKLRFTDAYGETTYPDAIWVVDEKAKQLAIEEGLPAELIKVMGNPYHYYLQRQWKPLWEGKSYLGSFNIPTDGFHILFAPDPLSLRNTKEKVGFSEEEALHDIQEVVSVFNNKKIYLIIKCHPLQPKNILEKQINKAQWSNVSLLQSVDTLELINTADMVIGFYSNFLLDASALGKNVVRYYPGNSVADLLYHKADLKRISTKKELLTEIESAVFHWKMKA